MQNPGSCLLPGTFFLTPRCLFLSCLLAEILKQRTSYFFGDVSPVKTSFNSFTFKLPSRPLVSASQKKMGPDCGMLGDDSFPLILICAIDTSKESRTAPFFDEVGAPWY